ncbi:ATPase, partial [Acidovorax sp. HMWF018]|uniref:cation transporting ATPase C-terminal domain-containing protein n=1 Tax=Acidovorax sp. HMWF018 TaxID=2056855 RepID=UPI000D4434EB
LELVIDPACSIVFEAEKGAADLMQQPPRAADEPLLSARHILLSVLQGSVVTAAVVGLYAWLLSQPAHAATASTAAFVVLVAANAALILPSRSSQTVWRSLWAGLTPVSLWVAGGTLAALTAITTVPWLANAFRFVPLSPLHWFMALLAGLLLTVVFAANKRWLQPTAPALLPSPA